MHFQLELPPEYTFKMCDSASLFTTPTCLVELHHCALGIGRVLPFFFFFWCSTRVWGFHCSCLGVVVIAALHVSRNAVICSHYAVFYGMETRRFNP